MKSDGPNQPILIAVCTLGINSNLSDLLRQLIEFKKESLHQIRLLIVWNSKNRCSIGIPAEIEVVIQCEIGYATARNTALKHRKDNESLLFIDDDELLQIDSQHQSFSKINFLDNHISAAKEFPKSIFIGPYLPVDLDGKTLMSEWKLLSEKSYGEIVEFGSGGNLFLPADVFIDRSILFDTFFNFGGEDTKLVRDLALTGIATRWVPNAVLFEKTPPIRYSKPWQSKRLVKNFLINVIIQTQYFGPHRIKRVAYASKILAMLFFGESKALIKEFNVASKIVIFFAIVNCNCSRIRMLATNGETYA